MALGYAISGIIGVVSKVINATFVLCYAFIYGNVGKQICSPLEAQHLFRDPSQMNSAACRGMESKKSLLTANDGVTFLFRTKQCSLVCNVRNLFLDLGEQS